MNKLRPEDLHDENNFELLKEISHKELREFVIEQIVEEKVISRIYSVYQMIMIFLFTFLLAKNTILAIKGHWADLVATGWALIFSFTILIVLHELLHALAYILTGARKISFGMDLKKFVFYAQADKQVIAPRAFHWVALAPFVVVKLLCLVASIVYFGEPPMYFFVTIMCAHSLFCAGDMGMIAFFNIHREKEIYHFDDKSEGKTYFYSRKNKIL